VEAHAWQLAAAHDGTSGDAANHGDRRQSDMIRYMN